VRLTLSSAGVGQLHENRVRGTRPFCGRLSRAGLTGSSVAARSNVSPAARPSAYEDPAGARETSWSGGLRAARSRQQWRPAYPHRPAAASLCTRSASAPGDRLVGFVASGTMSAAAGTRSCRRSVAQAHDDGPAAALGKWSSATRFSVVSGQPHGIVILASGTESSRRVLDSWGYLVVRAERCRSWPGGMRSRRRCRAGRLPRSRRGRLERHGSAEWRRQNCVSPAVVAAGVVVISGGTLILLRLAAGPAARRSGRPSRTVRVGWLSERRDDKQRRHSRPVVGRWCERHEDLIAAPKPSSEGGVRERGR